MGSMHVNKDGKLYRIDDNMTGAQVKETIGAPPESVLINARQQTIADGERVGSKVSDGEAVAAVPQFQYWRGE